MDVDCLVPQLCCRQRHWNNKACSSCDVLVVHWEIITSAKKVCDRCCLSVIRRSFCLGNFWKFISISHTIPWQDVCLSIRPSVCHTPVLCLNGYTYPQTYRRVAHNSSFSTPNAMAIFWRGSVGKFLESRLTVFSAHTNVIKITIPKMADTSKDELLLDGGMRHIRATSQYQ